MTTAELNELFESLDKPSYSTGEVAEILGTNITKVGALIREGEIVAINTAMTTAQHRPRYRILNAAFKDFLRRRAVVPPSPRPARRQRRETDASVIEFF
jgi:hypothetical protein